MDGWAALADPARRTILELLIERPRAVREVADLLPVTRPAVSQHLKLLKMAGLVVDRADGTRRIYSANPDALRDLRAQLDRFWTEALNTFQQLVQEPEEEA